MTKYMLLIIALIVLGYFVFVVATPEETTPAPASQDGVIQAPYGAWESRLTAAKIFEASDDVSALTADGDNLFFIEKRATANGRNILMQLDANDGSEQLTPSDLSVRSRVHEYGGRPYLADGDNIYYSRFTDQKLYRRSPGGEAQALTDDGLRYMECVADHFHGQLICVQEDHRGLGEAVNTLVAIDLSADGEVRVLYEGTDFVKTPRLSPDGRSVAFITWSHPNMPWDDTQLRIVTLGADGLPEKSTEIPQTGNVAFSNPEFAEDGTLYFTADFANWLTLYRIGKDGDPELVLDQEVEIKSYGLENESSAIVAYFKNGIAHIARVDLASGELSIIGAPFSSVSSVAISNHGAYFIAATATSKSAIYKLGEDSYREIYRPSGPAIAEDQISVPKSITFPTGDGEEAYGFFYAPRNDNFAGPDGALPPLIVVVHGGPVGASYATLSLSIQYWTSRGFAVFAVNHRGSTGYGRAFRKKLYPNWGIVDIEDASNGVRWLAAQGLVDKEKVAIRGGSAGGYTTLGALAFGDSFKAGASYFGVSDLEILARETHKYESRYLDQLIGPYPEMRDVYIERSPINSADQIKSPLLLLHGLDDEVVPPNQSRMMFEILKQNCVPAAYLTFEGEGHGFRQPANQIKALESELDFYGQIFGFTPAGDIESVHVQRCEDVAN